MTPPTAPGVYRNMPDAVYRAIPAVSQSTLKQFTACPRKFKLAPKKEPTDAMRWGSYVDALWLTGDISPFAVMPDDLDGRTNVGKAWKAANADKSIITPPMQERALAAVKRLNETPETREAREACDVQVAVVAELDGILCKALIDLCPHDGIRTALADLKTAPSADPAEWARYVFNMKLHWQSSFYLDVWNNATSENVEDWFHVVVEQEAPHEPCILPLSREFIDLGRAQVRAALHRYNECLKTDMWPGYQVPEAIRPERWMTRQD